MPDEGRFTDERHLIARIARAVPSVSGRSGRKRGIDLGIGDDAMVMRPRPGHQWVVTVDAFMEGVHFWPGQHPADSVGYKALARATSDLAAMGAAPRWFLMTLALPKARMGPWLDGFLRGMGRAARRFGLRLTGGDTTQGQKVALSLTVIGEARPGRVVTRAGARPGDAIYVSGILGRAELGLELMRRRLGVSVMGRKLTRRHLYPEIRLELGQWLAQHRVASAMMDLSDGLSSDLARLCAASRVGARVDADRLPCVVIPRRFARQLGKRADPLRMALHGGDDYELLFSVPAKMIGKLQGAPGFRSFRAIGEIQRGSGVALLGPDGKTTALAPGGWDPFRT